MCRVWHLREFLPTQCIGIIVAIVGVIVGIFIFKSVKDNEDTAPETSTSESQTDGSTANYPLKITKTDLDTIKAYGISTVIEIGRASCRERV